MKRFFDAPSQGYTDIEEGMLAALKQVAAVKGLGVQRPASTVLITDGKYTAGKDPSYLAPRFERLHVIKIGSDQSSLRLCEELALKGRGHLRQIAGYEDLPASLYSIVKGLVSSRSY